MNESFKLWLGHIPGLGMGHELYTGICNEFPQFNDRTKINPVDTYQIELANMEPQDFPGPKKLYKKHGFKSRLWRALGELLNRSGIYNRGVVGYNQRK